MTDEIKNVEECKKEHKECKCEKILTKFLLNTVSIFFGVFFALAAFKGLTTPKFPPCPCAMARYGMERPVYPHMMKHNNFGMGKIHKGHHPRFDKMKHFENRGPQKDFDKQNPQKNR